MVAAGDDNGVSWSGANGGRMVAGNNSDRNNVNNTGKMMAVVEIVTTVIKLVEIAY